MYAIVEIAGQQYKVEKDQQIFVNRLQGKEGSKVSFDKVLLTADGKKVEVGAPAVKGVSVSAKIVEHLKGDKTIVFKKKRRKGYRVKNGHRQFLSKIEIESIGKSSGGSKSTAKSTAKSSTKKSVGKTSSTKTTASKSDEKKTSASSSKAKAVKKAPAKGSAEKPKASKKAVKKEPAKKSSSKTTAKKSKQDKKKKEDK